MATMTMLICNPLLSRKTGFRSRGVLFLPPPLLDWLGTPPCHVIAWLFGELKSCFRCWSGQILGGCEAIDGCKFERNQVCARAVCSGAHPCFDFQFVHLLLKNFQRLLTFSGWFIEEEKVTCQHPSVSKDHATKVRERGQETNEEDA